MRRTNEVKLMNVDELSPDAREFVYIMNNISLKLTRSGDVKRRISPHWSDESWRERAKGFNCD